MTDRELLELAAKAAGLTVHALHQAGRDACAGHSHQWPCQVALPMRLRHTGITFVADKVAREQAHGAAMELTRGATEPPAVCHAGAVSQGKERTMTDSRDPIIWRRDLNNLLQLSSDSVRRMLKEGKLPPPDVDLSRKTRGWKRSTLKAAGVNL